MNISFLLTALGLVVLYFSIKAIKNYNKQKNREKIRLLAFPQEWSEILNNEFPLYRRLPVQLKTQLHTDVMIFVAEKYFAGFNGVVIDDEIRVLIAAQACILLLNRETNYYPTLHAIKVYPRAFVNKGGSVGGLRKIARVGESWLHGAVILSWEDVVRGAKFENDGSNVVFHEFAHQLDQEEGSANGLPILYHNDITSWGKVFRHEFKTLQKQTKRGSKSFFDKYGATNAAEFFAVVTETFIEEPKRFKKYHPDLYRELSQYYHLDPISWR